MKENVNEIGERIWNSKKGNREGMRKLSRNFTLNLGKVCRKSEEFQN